MSLDLTSYIIEDSELSSLIVEVELLESVARQLKGSFDYEGFDDFYYFMSFNKSFFVEPNVQKSMNDYSVKGSSLIIVSPEHERRCYITKEAREALYKYQMNKNHKFYDYEKFDVNKFQILSDSFCYHLRRSSDDFGFNKEACFSFDSFNVDDFRKIYVSLFVKIGIPHLLIKKLIGMPLHADEQKKAKISISEIQAALYQYADAYCKEVKKVIPHHSVNFFYRF